MAMSGKNYPTTLTSGKKAATTTMLREETNTSKDAATTER